MSSRQTPGRVLNATPKVANLSHGATELRRRVAPRLAEPSTSVFEPKSDFISLTTRVRSVQSNLHLRFPAGFVLARPQLHRFGIVLDVPILGIAIQRSTRPLRDVAEMT